MNWKTTLVICVLILAAAAAVTAVVFSTEPTATRVTATKKTAMLVDVVEVQRGTYRPTIVALGSVEPARDIVLSPRVSGEIVEMAPGFTPGGFVDKEEILLRIAPSDYETALARRRSELQQALADLDIEMGRQTVAQRDLQLVEEEIPEIDESLVLRKPQLETAKAEVEAARAAVRRAELDLERTTIRAPFDAHILTREANLGSQVSPGESLARLVGLEEYWVVTTVPLSMLRWISFPEGRRQGAEVSIRDRAAWPDGVTRTGRVDKLVGALEERTRLARVLVTVRDPLARAGGSAGELPLMIGSFVEARIVGEKIADVVRLDRNYVRKDGTAWVMEEGKLRIRELEILLQDEEFAYVASGLNEGDRVVTTNLATVVDGAPLRLAPEEGADAAGETGGSP